MEEKHYIEFVELIADGRVCRKFLKPGDRPEFEFGSKPAQYTAESLLQSARALEVIKRFLSCFSFIIIVFNCTLLL